MVARPRVLVCDEPTSGLDATSAKEVIAASEFQTFFSFRAKLLELRVDSNFSITWITVKHLAVSTNTICIATIHQPNYETFSIFDK